MVIRASIFCILQQNPSLFIFDYFDLCLIPGPNWCMLYNHNYYTSAGRQACTEMKLSLRNIALSTTKSPKSTFLEKLRQKKRNTSA
ncbi:hypothetical protein N665_5048s0003 [Sinapis alba]|nr:hypothetical protein N665_5048s0003 [Sinapis alba]